MNDLCLNDLYCDGCGEPAPILEMTGPEHPGFVGGWSFAIDSLGYYGGFTDTFDRDGLVHICHSCCVNLLSALPGLRMFVPSLAHPNLNVPKDYVGSLLDWNPCCGWAFAWEDDEMYCVDENGRWVKGG